MSLPAIEQLREAVRLDPNDAEGFFRLGFALDVTGDHTGAARAFDKAARLRPEYRPGFSMAATLLKGVTDLDGMVAECREWLPLEYSSSQTHECLGEDLLAKQDIYAAHAEFKEAVRLQPDYSEAHYHLGEVLQNEADLEGAADEYEKALRSKTEYPEALNKRGEIEIALKRPYSAYDFLRKALRIQPDFVEARYNLGRAFEADGKIEDALAEYKQAHNLAPTDAAILVSLERLAKKLHHKLSP